MNAEGSPLLAQLADIHGAAQPGWWPPAPGWWLLGLVLLALLALALRKALARLAVRRRRKAWIGALEALRREHDPARQPREYLAGLNRLFRAVALRAFPGEACSRLQGEDWVAFIASLLPDPAAGDALRALASGPYEPEPRFDAAALQASARTWVKLYG